VAKKPEDDLEAFRSQFLADLDELRGHVDRMARLVGDYLEEKLRERGQQPGTVHPIRPGDGDE
jgi:hypothetical protein